VLVGSETPRIWTRPLRELTPETSLGFEVIQFSEQILGIELLPWQKWLFIHGLELKPGGTYRFRTVLTLVARQNGKTTALNILTLWRLVMDGARVVMGTSTNLDYARKSWLTTVSMAKGSPAIFDEFKWPETRTNGRESLETKDGAFYGIATASRTGGRSLSVDLLILDEIREHKTWEAWSASSKTTNARPRGQRWAISNMGDDNSVVLNHLREKAIEGTDPSLGIFEWSAPPGCDTADRSVWPLANPAMGYTISEEAIASDHGTDAEPVFRTEVLCQHVPTLEPLPITIDMWRGAEKHRQQLPSGAPVFGVSVAPSQLSAAVVPAVKVSTSVAHLELADHRNGIDWVVPRLKELKKAHPRARFVMVSTGAAVALLPDLIKSGVEPELLNTTELGKAYAHMQKRLQDGQVTQSGAEAFEWALQGAVKRDVGEGLWSLGWRKASSDLTPIEGAAIGLWLLESTFQSVPRIF
jgi:phage terminase large subunit-like protein